MADTSSVLHSVRERIAELARLADAGNAEAAKKLAEELTREIEQALGQRPAPKQSAPRAPRDDVVKCPRCTLRGFTFQKGRIREAEGGGFEAFYQCTSCGHQGWLEIG
jgi:DNA-directed RNA polymerase subunit M/transcription elongation factor TFIIS